MGILGSAGDFLKGGANVLTLGQIDKLGGGGPVGSIGNFLGLTSNVQDPQSAINTQTGYEGQLFNGAQQSAAMSAMDRERQMALASLLFQRLTGAGPSVASSQLAAGMDATNRNANAHAAMFRGGASVLSRYLAANAGANAAGDMNQAQGLARVQEQTGAANQLGNVLGDARQGDVGTYGAQVAGGTHLGSSVLTANAQANQANQQQYDKILGAVLQGMGQGKAAGAMGG